MSSKFSELEDYFHPIGGIPVSRRSFFKSRRPIVSGSLYVVQIKHQDLRDKNLLTLHRVLSEAPD